jgi:hypothetical protein
MPEALHTPEARQEANNILENLYVRGTMDCKREDLYVRGCICEGIYMLEDLYVRDLRGFEKYRCPCNN